MGLLQSLFGNAGNAEVVVPAGARDLMRASDEAFANAMAYDPVAAARHKSSCNGRILAGEKNESISRLQAFANGRLEEPGKADHLFGCAQRLVRSLVVDEVALPESLVRQLIVEAFHEADALNTLANRLRIPGYSCGTDTSLRHVRESLARDAAKLLAEVHLVLRHR